MTLQEKIRQLSETYFEEIRSVRRHLHANPELSFQEFETSAFIQTKLTEYNIPFTVGFAGTGIVAMIQGKDPSSRTVALRGDLDALPIEELNNVDYKSTHPGIMHACGHDVHTSCLLGSALILNKLKDEWSGTVKFLFQPGEEKNPGGASLMVKEGALENPRPEFIIGQHVHPPLEVGKVGMKPGVYMASADEIYIRVIGKGGHGALPQDNIDPVLIAAHVITALQQVVSRRCPPLVPCVLSFGKVIANGATNIIPDKVEMEGTFRTFDEEWRFRAHEIIKEIAVNTCKAMGGDCEIDVSVGYPYLENDVRTTEKVWQKAVDYLGEENVVELGSRMTAEDFSYYTRELPGCFYRLGTGNPEKNITSPIHTPTFDIDEEALKTGMGLMAWLAVE